MNRIVYAKVLLVDRKRKRGSANDEAYAYVVSRHELRNKRVLVHTVSLERFDDPDPFRSAAVAWLQNVGAC